MKRIPSLLCGLVLASSLLPAARVLADVNPGLGTSTATPCLMLASSTDMNVKIDIDWKKAGAAVADGVKWVWKKLTSFHPIDQNLFRIDNRWDVVMVPVTKSASGGRITNGLHLTRVYGAPMNGKFRVYFANTGKVNPRDLAIQAKKNERLATDENWGGIIRNGDLVPLPGAKHRYFASRSPYWKEGMMIVITPSDMPPDKLAKIPGVQVRR